MENAINLFNYIFQKFINMIFNDFEIQSGVTIGWVIITIILFGMLINNILNIPNNVRFNKKYNSRPVKTQKGTNVNG